MDMSRFLVDAYFTEHSDAAFSMGSSDPETLTFSDIAPDFSKYRNAPLEYALHGYRPLRTNIASLYKQLSAENIAVVNGGEEAIYIVMRSLLQAGDELLVQTPSYQSLSVVAEAAGCRVIPVPMSFENRWRFDIEAYRRALTPRTKMMVINYPHNPTGAALTTQDLEVITDFCETHRLTLVSDEAYRFLEIEPGYSTTSLADYCNNAVALGSFSKTFAAPGLRLGWVATRNPTLLSRFSAYRHFTSTCTNLPCQWIGNEILARRSDIIARSNRLIQENARLLADFIAAFPQYFAYVPPAGASMAYVRLLNGRRASVFAEDVLKATGVLLIPSSVLETSDEFLRIGLGRKSFPECVRRVSRYLTETTLSF